jgi:MerR family transcriptional regulator, repressor of the yfmOP operon
VDAGMSGSETFPIGQMAERLALSPRTLRYYEEVGLLTPSTYTAGGSRRYNEGDFQRVLRIRELQAVMGFNLEEIREIMHAQDRLVELGAEYRGGATASRQRDIVIEAARLNARTQEQVLAKIAILEAFQAELLVTAQRCAKVAEDFGIDLQTAVHSDKDSSTA